MKRTWYAVAAVSLVLTNYPALARADEAEERELRQEITALMEKARDGSCHIDMAQVGPLKPGRLLLRIFVERTKLQKTVVREELETTVQNHEVRVLDTYVGNIKPNSVIHMNTVLAFEPSVDFVHPILTSLEHSVVILRKERGHYILEGKYRCQDS